MPSSSPSQRPLRELRTLYQVRPGIRDVIVEGRSDAQLIQWYLNECGLVALAHAVDDRVYVPSDLVVRHGGEVGARGRVVGLSHEADQWDLTESTVTCIADTDRECLLETPQDTPQCLLLTDYGTMDVYLLQDRPFAQFLSVVLGRTADAESLRERLIPPLNELCVVRSVLHWSGIGVSLVRDFVSCCEFGQDRIAVDTEELLRRTLDGPDSRHRGQLLEVIEATRTRIPAERLKAVRGHDMAPLLIKELRLRNVWANAEAFERAWRGCLQASDLDEFPMFGELRRRVGVPGV